MNNPSPTPRTDACPHCGAKRCPPTPNPADEEFDFECGTFLDGPDYPEDLRRDFPCYERELSALKAKLDRAREGLEFYANPETYWGVAFIPDGESDFMDDFEILSDEMGHPDGGSWEKPGKKARATLAELES